MIFQDRSDAGRRLSERLRHLAHHDVVVLGLPRGGVPVAYEVAQALRAPLDVVVVRKLGLPGRPELAMGAVGEGGVVVHNDEVLALGGVRPAELQRVTAREQAEVTRRAGLLRGARPPADVTGRTVLLVDDGIATGATAAAACQVMRAQGAAHVVLAAPVAPPDAVQRLRAVADEVVCVHAPVDFSAVGEWYRDFSQTPDEEVRRLLAQARRADHARSEFSSAALDEEVVVRAGAVALDGHLTSPDLPRGLVVFAHGSGSTRSSPRNVAVALALQHRGFATLLIDLLTEEEQEVHRADVVDVELLAGRLAAATRWLRQWEDLRDLRVGLLGASTGAAAALWAASLPDADVAAVVSRGGRPDLADARLPLVKAPTLLVVGSRDEQVLELNRRAQAALRCESRLAVVPGATHLFDEPGTLDAVGALAGDWFVSHLAPTMDAAWPGPAQRR